jgi:MFS family permease
MKHPMTLTPQERWFSLLLSTVFALRILCLFIVLPVFSILSHDYKGATPSLIGIALGAYGIASGLLQAPWGWLSDRFGRKPVIILGLLLFALGSVIAGSASTILGLIAGRMLQGVGAVGSTVLALLADITRPEVRTRAMGIVGMTIGISFVVAMLLGPIVSSLIGLSGVFYCTALLSIGAILSVIAGVPKGTIAHTHLDQGIQVGALKQALTNSMLWRLNFGVFMLHAVFTASFVVVPLTLWQHTGLQVTQQWRLYLPVLLSAFLSSYLNRIM